MHSIRLICVPEGEKRGKKANNAHNSKETPILRFKWPSKPKEILRKKGRERKGRGRKEGRKEGKKERR